jgi:hypothetical protein
MCQIKWKCNVPNGKTQGCSCLQWHGILVGLESNNSHHLHNMHEDRWWVDEKINHHPFEWVVSLKHHNSMHAIEIKKWVIRELTKLYGCGFVKNCENL